MINFLKFAGILLLITIFITYLYWMLSFILVIGMLLGTFYLINKSKNKKEKPLI